MLLVAALSAICSPAYGNAYFNDFSTPDAVDGWAVISGTWQLDDVAGTYSNTTTAQTALSVYTGPFAGGVDGSVLYDYSITADIAVNGGGTSLIARYKDSANYYMFRYKSVTGEVQLYRFANGATNLVTETVSPGSIPALRCCSSES